MVEKPGPKKVAPLELDTLMDDIRALGHKRKRTHGTGELYEQRKFGISRRELNALVKRVRDEINGEKRANQRRITWHCPGVVWSMDDTEYGRDDMEKKLYIHNVHDLASRYKFEPPAGDFARKEVVADNLGRLFKMKGRPLFMKRDNGSNFKNPEVDAVLSTHMVIPLDSPPYYPPYNGSIEKAQHELKSTIQEKQGDLKAFPRAHFQAYAESAVHTLNHKPRRSLKGKTACHIFYSKKGGEKYTKRKRKEIFEWIKRRSCEIMTELGSQSKKAARTAWRHAAEAWLLKNGLITITLGKNVLPTFL